MATFFTVAGIAVSIIIIIIIQPTENSKTYDNVKGKVWPSRANSPFEDESMNEIFDLSNMAQVSSAQVDNIVKRLAF